jgi:hypothetical protein
LSGKLGPEIQYAWDKQWVIEWNVPRRETSGKGTGRVVEYDHKLVIQLDLQDGDRNHVREFTRSITLFTTDHMLTVEDRIRHLTGREIRRQIIDNLVSLKSELSGYSLSVR